MLKSTQAGRLNDSNSSVTPSSNLSLDPLRRNKRQDISSKSASRDREPREEFSDYLRNSVDLKAGLRSQLDSILEDELPELEATFTGSRRKSISKPVGLQSRRHLENPRSSSTSKPFFSVQNPSLYSVASNLTNSSSGSSGSNSTVTPHSYDKSPPERRKKRVEKLSRRKANRDGQTAAKRTQRSVQQTNPKMMEKTQDLLIHLEDSPTNTGPSGFIAGDQPRASSSAGSNRDALTRRRSWTSQEKFHSDSGISVQSSSPDKESIEPQHDSDSDSDSEGAGAGPRPPGSWDSGSTLPGHYNNTNALPDPDPMVQRLQNQEEELRQHILHSPQPLRFTRPAVTSSYEHPPVWNPYGGPLMNAPSVGYSYHPYAYEAFPPSSQHPEDHEPEKLPPVEEAKLAGYDLIASKLSEQYKPSSKDSIRPLYRRFEQLNHRILLHLQDEISELEEELRQLDQSIATMNVDSEKHSRSPHSRRQEAQFGSELHHRRTEVLGKVFVKLGQYNKAIKGYRAAFAYSSRPDSGHWQLKSDIEDYRNWMEKNAPIHESEARFLEHEDDLICLPKRWARERRIESIKTVSTVAVIVAGIFCIAVIAAAAFEMSGVAAGLTVYLLAAVPGLCLHVLPKYKIDPGKQEWSLPLYWLYVDLLNSYPRFMLTSF